jgi:hypothetical protein
MKGDPCLVERMTDFVSLPDHVLLARLPMHAGVCLAGHTARLSAQASPSRRCKDALLSVANSLFQLLQDALSPHQQAVAAVIAAVAAMLVGTVAPCPGTLTGACTVLWQGNPRH